MKIYEITEEIKVLEELYLEAIDEETGELKSADILEEFEKELNDQLTNKGANIIAFIQNSELTTNAIDIEIKRLTALKKQNTKKLDNFKNYLVVNMERMGTKKIETNLGTLSLRSSESVGINDSEINKEDERYTEKITDIKISKAKIKALLDAGEEVKGAYILEKNNLNIK